MEEIKTKGGFYCPHCLKLNLCDCKTCKKFYDENGIGDMKYCIWTEDNESFICSYCNEPFTPCASLDTEYRITKFNTEVQSIIKKIRND